MFALTRLLHIIHVQNVIQQISSWIITIKPLLHVQFISCNYCMQFIACNKLHM